MSTKIYSILSLVLLLLVLLFLCFQYTDAEDIFEFYHQEIKHINHLYVVNHARLSSQDEITDEELNNRLFHLFRYSMTMESTGVDPRRRFKDVVAIIVHETRFVNFLSVDDGAGFGWFSMQKNHIKTLNNYFKFKNHSYNTILNSDKLQAKYVIANYEFLMQTYEDRFKAILGYNRGQAGVKGELRSEEYFFEVLGLIAYYDAKLREWKQ